MTRRVVVSGTGVGHSKFRNGGLGSVIVSVAPVRLYCNFSTARHRREYVVLPMSAGTPPYFLGKDFSISHDTRFCATSKDAHSQHGCYFTSKGKQWLFVPVSTFQQTILVGVRRHGIVRHPLVFRKSGRQPVRMQTTAALRHDLTHPFARVALCHIASEKCQYAELRNNHLRYLLRWM